MIIRRFLTFTKISALSMVTTFGITTTINAQEPNGPSFINLKANNIDEEIKSFYGLSGVTKSSDAATIRKLTNLQKAMAEPEVLVFPNNDTDEDGLNDFLEVYGFYDDAGVATGLDYVMSLEEWDEFINRPTVMGYPVFSWAANALESDGYAVVGSENVTINVSKAYETIKAKFEQELPSLTHHLITGSPGLNGSIASIMAQLVTQYEPLIPIVNGKPVQVYYTNYKLVSSDYDPYSDKEEALNLLSAGGPKSPANHPLIGAIPNIRASLTNYTLTDIKENRVTNGTSTKHSDVEREVTTLSHSHGVSFELKREWELGAGGGVKWSFAGKISNSVTAGTAISTEDRDSFGTSNSTTNVTSFDCFSKLKLNIKLENTGSDLASDIQPRLDIYIGDKLFKTESGVEQGQGPTLDAGDADDPRIATGLEGDEGCLTLDQANYLYHGGSIRIKSELVHAGMRYFNPQTGLVEVGGNWEIAKINFEQNLAQIILSVVTTENVEINRTFWVTADDPTDNLPNMHVSIRDVLEKAYTPIDCKSENYDEGELCLRTDHNGDIILRSSNSVTNAATPITTLNFNFFDDETNEALDYEDSLTKMAAMLPEGKVPAIDKYLPRHSSVSIYDMSSRLPEIVHTEVINRVDRLSNAQQVEIRASVNDFHGVKEVFFCKQQDDCIAMQGGLPDQPKNPQNGYYKLMLDNYELQGTEYLSATNVLDKTSPQMTPTKFYLGLMGAEYQYVEDLDNYLKQVEQWLATYAQMRVDYPDTYSEIIGNNLMESEVDATAIYTSLVSELNKAKKACSYENTTLIESPQALIGQLDSCKLAVNNYQQVLLDTDVRIYNPNKMPLKNVLETSTSLANHTDKYELECRLGEYDVITGMKLKYKANRKHNIGVWLSYRTIEPSNDPDSGVAYKWSTLKGKRCGYTSGDSEKESVLYENDIDGTTIKALVDFGWSVRKGNVTKLCAVYRDFDLATATFGKAYDEGCSWRGLHRFSNTSQFRPYGSNEIEQKADYKALNGMILNAKYSSAQATLGWHTSYQYKYQEPTEHSLISGQEYRLRANNNGYLTIKGLQSNSRSIALEANSGTEDQIWIVEAVNDREFRLVPKLFEGYLARHDETDGENSVFVLATNPETESASANYKEHWRISENADHSYKIKSVVTLKSLNSDGVMQHEENVAEDGFDWRFISADEPVEPSLKAMHAYIGIQELGSTTKNLSIILPDYAGNGWPLVFASMQTSREEEPAGLRVEVLSKDRLKWMVQEEQSKRQDVSHVEEQMSYLVFEPENTDNDGFIRDADGEVIGEVGKTFFEQRDYGDEDEITFRHQYNNPVVIMMMNSYYDKHPAHIRIKSVSNSGDSVKYKVEEWGYQDQNHGNEKVAYWVVEAGTHTLPNGQVLQAFNKDLDHNWTNVDFPAGFGQTPKVFSQSQTFKGPDPIVTRQKQVSPNSFKLRLQEEQNKDGWHGKETVGVIAIGNKQ